MHSPSSRLSASLSPSLPACCLHLHQREPQKEARVEIKLSISVNTDEMRRDKTSVAAPTNLAMVYLCLLCLLLLLLLLLVAHQLILSLFLSLSAITEVVYADPAGVGHVQHIVSR